MSAGLRPIAADPSIAGGDGNYIIAAMHLAKMLLPHMMERLDPREFAALRADAETIRVYVHKNGLGRNAELAAAEIVRRAERGVALAIRRGQEDGTIVRQREHGGNQYTGNLGTGKIKPETYASKGELMGGGGDGRGGSKPGYYALADDVTDEQFEEAIARAIAERNLTRMNVYRRLRPAAEANGHGWIPGAVDRGGEASARRREVIAEMAAGGYSSRQISERLGTLDGTVRRIAREEGIVIHADKAIARTKVHDGDRIVEETTHILEGAAMALTLVNPGELDPARVRDWVASLTTSTRAINRFVKEMKETTSDHQD